MDFTNNKYFWLPFKPTLLGANEDVWDVLVFAEQRDVQQDLKWLGVSSQDNKLRNTTVQSLGGCVLKDKLKKIIDEHNVIQTTCNAQRLKGDAYIEASFLPRIKSADEPSGRKVQACNTCSFDGSHTPSLAPLRSCLYEVACWTKSRMVWVSSLLASG